MQIKGNFNIKWGEDQVLSHIWDSKNVKKKREEARRREEEEEEEEESKKGMELVWMLCFCVELVWISRVFYGFLGS